VKSQNNRAFVYGIKNYIRTFLRIPVKISLVAYSTSQ
jgi:hypothetical protein